MPFVAESQGAEEGVLDQGSMPLIALHQTTASGGARRIHSWNSSADAGSSSAAAEGTLADAHLQPCRKVQEVLRTI
jgi:hypothetical protein